MAINTPYGQNNPITTYEHWAINSSFTGSTSPITNFEKVGSGGTDISESIGTGLTYSSGAFTFPSTGKWLLQWMVNAFIAATDQSYVGMYLYISTNSGTNFSHIVHTYSGNGQGYVAGSAFYIMDVTNTSTHRFKFDLLASGGSNSTTQARTDGASTGFMVSRIGDT